MVTTWRPMACGIGKYAEQQVTALRRQGYIIDILSPPEGDGDFCMQLLGGLRPLRLFKVAWAYDAVWVHYTQHFFFVSDSRLNRLVTSFAFLILMLVFGRRFTFIVHESGVNVDQGNSGGLRRLIDRWWWARAHRVVFHSHRERDAFAAHHGMKPEGGNLEIWPHERDFERCTDLDRDDARAMLGVEPDVVLLVCLGFIQPHKGFDRVIEALAAVPEATRVRFKIIGSVRIAWDVAHAYARRLHEMAAQDPRVEVIETWLSDEMFDTWIVASDYIVLPYRQIWSSSVAARARLYDRPLIAADTGALSEQLTEGSFLFREDAELVDVLRRIAGETRAQ